MINGPKLKAIRNLLGLTQQEFVTVVLKGEYKREALSQWESETREIWSWIEESLQSYIDQLDSADALPHRSAVLRLAKKYNYPAYSEYGHVVDDRVMYSIPGLGEFALE